jgi:hypothetical protein
MIFLYLLSIGEEKLGVIPFQVEWILKKKTAEALRALRKEVKSYIELHND